MEKVERDFREVLMFNQNLRKTISHLLWLAQGKYSSDCSLTQACKQIISNTESLDVEIIEDMTVYKRLLSTIEFCGKIGSFTNFVGQLSKQKPEDINELIKLTCQFIKTMPLVEDKNSLTSIIEPDAQILN